MVDNIEFIKEKVSVETKISSDLITELNFYSQREYDDFVYNTMTVKLVGYIHSNLAEERDLVYHCKRPSFFDWLFRRRKSVTFNLKVKDLLINPPKTANTKRIYIFEQQTK